MNPAAAAAVQAQVLIRPLEERKSQNDNELRNASFIKKYQFKISLNLQSRFEDFYERNKITKKNCFGNRNKLIN